MRLVEDKKIKDNEMTALERKINDSGLKAFK